MNASGHRFGPWTMSNGTLRFLALGYIFLTKQSHETLGGPRVVVVEEPATGVYAGHLKELFSLVDRTGANGQFIFTSHSPYFIDLFDGLLDGVSVAKPGERNTPIVGARQRARGLGRPGVPGGFAARLVFDRDRRLDIQGERYLR